MKIMQIAVVPESENQFEAVLGLGDDGNVYLWDKYTATWELFKVN